MFNGAGDTKTQSHTIYMLYHCNSTFSSQVPPSDKTFQQNTPNEVISSKHLQNRAMLTLASEVLFGAAVSSFFKFDRMAQHAALFPLKQQTPHQNPNGCHYKLKGGHWCVFCVGYGIVPWF